MATDATAPPPAMLIDWSPPGSTANFLLFIETWAPLAPEQRQRFRDQLAAVCHAEGDLRQKGTVNMLGLVSVSLEERTRRVAELETLIRESQNLLAAADTLFQRLMTLADNMPNTPALRQLSSEVAARFHYEDDTQGGPC